MNPAKLCSAALCLFLVTGPLAAQSAGTFEVGLFGQASYLDKSLGLDQAKGGPGARVGFFVTRNLNLEAEGAFVPTHGRVGEVYYIPLRARIDFNIPTGEHGGLFL